MHSKLKGNVGQLMTAAFLSQLGYSVFIEAGDISRIDIIAEKKGKLLTFQCKSVTPVAGKLPLNLRKCGPNYNFKYEQGDFDFFAVYDLTNRKLYLVPSSILLSKNRTFSLRVVDSKNGQKSKVNLAQDYLAELVLVA